MRQFTIDKASGEAFAAWAQAYADLVAAERAGVDADQTMELTNDVLRAHIALVRTRTAAGWFPTAESVNRMRLEEHLLRLGERWPG
ncbi:MAG TPA: hypothetical protein VIJ96_00485 [Acidothermaceae bacterium]